MSENKGLVSIIVPCYNHASFLHKRMASIFSQTYTHFEVILLDDCSTDGSRRILNEFSHHPNVVYMEFNYVNSGSPYRQWLKGIQHAKGEWVWIAESDDWADSDFLKILIEGASENTVMAFCHSHIAFDETVRNAGRAKGSHISGRLFIEDKMVRFPSVFNASMAVFKRAAFKPAYLTEKPELTYCKDWFFWLNVIASGNVYEYEGKLNYFRQHPDKVSPSADKRGLNFTEGAVIWSFILHDLKVRISFLQKAHIAFRWVLSVKRFEQGVEFQTLQAMKNHTGIVLLFQIMRPFRAILSGIYSFIKAI